MTIDEHRTAIDELDARIVELLNERTRHVLEIGEIKLASDEEIYAPHRELDVVQRVVRLNKGPIPDESLRAVYREIMSSALALQKSMTVAYLGPEATFTHQAAVQRFGLSIRYSAQKTIADVFNEVSTRRADYGLVPVENSTEGVVTHTLDMFIDSELRIVSQIVMPIRHCLASLGNLTSIKKLYSHPQPVAQCRSWLQNHLPHIEIIETSSTTRAAELAASDKTAAAISSKLAADKYSLTILETNIQDNSQNATRFLVLGRQCSPPTGHDKTSLMFSIVDKIGALYGALAPFHKFGLNMTSIESRPSKRKPWEYIFFVDCDGHCQDEPVSKAIAELDKHCNYVKVLGSYPNTD